MAGPSNTNGAKPGLGLYDVIVKENLFDPLRGQGAQNEADEKARYASEQELINRYLVYGVSIINGRRQAFIKAVNTPQTSHPVFPLAGPQFPAMNQAAQAERPHPVKIGDSLEGWRITAITPHGIDLELRGRSVHLAIFGPEKDERRATAPVGLQTPQIKPEAPSPPQPGGEQPKEGGAAEGQSVQSQGPLQQASPSSQQPVQPGQPVPPPQAPSSIQHGPKATLPPQTPALPVPGSSLRDLLLGR
ncbi:MAG: hypothetical protein ACP5J5_00295 [Dissulfurimicrobium sp.]|uniref:hypothetical protein n=1 Tax=Dissulfurimicrobium TaxID=1769732 RepID=UPI001ED9E79F|nr:hypothetical protein [Dissulfurimicrobium hydrothermale]UKL14001.1 hypothetical protein LGS26_01730 [Dissulfurimicrobium hydrothermale]